MLRINVIENTFIPLSDSCKLAAKVWLPEDADQKPVPAILEYLPYRKRDGTAQRDQMTHPYFAERGYACIRVDMRGCGESDGLLEDEYLQQEQNDCLEVLQWIAKQPWCTGKIGMIGISWGGFNALQVAALRPKELAGIISLCSTDDRWLDIHYDGGSLLNDNFQWSHVMSAIMSQAPDPRLIGETWLEKWSERLEKLPFMAKTWLQHPLRDQYWKHGSICEDYSAIECPVFLVGGLADGYHSAIFRMISNLKYVKGLIGPWAHKYPHLGRPGPQIGFLQEALRWWDQCLKGIDTGVFEEPKLRVWMQDSVKPKPWYEVRPGRWIAEKTWPSENISTVHFFLHNNNKLKSKPSTKNSTQKICTPQTVGETSGAWMGYGFSPERPNDQRIDDARSFCFDTKPLNEKFEILGSPVLKLTIKVDQPEAFLCVRVNDVHPTGESLRITYGILNLNLRDSFEKYSPIIPGDTMDVSMTLNACAHSFPIGHKIRVSISTTYWPVVWPSYHPVTLDVVTGQFALPHRPPQSIDNQLAPFQEAVTPDPFPTLSLNDPKASREITRVLTDTTRCIYTVNEDWGNTYFIPTDLSCHYDEKSQYIIDDDDPKKAKAKHKTIVKMKHGDTETETKICSKMVANSTHYLLKRGLFASLNGQIVKKLEWKEEVPKLGK